MAPSQLSANSNSRQGEDTVDLTQSPPAFDATEWIGKGRQFPTNPKSVDAGLCDYIDHLKTMPELRGSPLPNPQISVDKFLEHTLPAVDTKTAEGTSNVYSNDTPSNNFEELLRIPLPDPAWIKSVEKGLGQAILDGRKSFLLQTRSTTTRLPFWILTWWRKASDVLAKQHKWRKAKEWVEKQKSKFDDDGTVKLLNAALESFASLGWDERSRVPGSETTTLAFATFLSDDDMMTTQHINMMFHNLDLTHRASKNSSNQRSVQTLKFSSEIRLRKTASENRHKPTFMKELEERIGSKEITSLLFPWFDERLKHWVTIEIDFASEVISVGDSLDQNTKNISSSLEAGIEELQDWIRNTKPPTRSQGNYRVSTGLAHSQQDDATSCGILCANTAAHNLLGFELWSSGRKVFERLRWYVNLTSLHAREKHVCFRLSSCSFSAARWKTGILLKYSNLLQTKGLYDEMYQSSVEPILRAIDTFESTKRAGLVYFSAMFAGPDSDSGEILGMKVAEEIRYFLLYGLVDIMGWVLHESKTPNLPPQRGSVASATLIDYLEHEQYLRNWLRQIDHDIFKIIGDARKSLKLVPSDHQGKLQAKASKSSAATQPDAKLLKRVSKHKAEAGKHSIFDNIISLSFMVSFMQHKEQLVAPKTANQLQCLMGKDKKCVPENYSQWWIYGPLGTAIAVSVIFVLLPEPLSSNSSMRTLLKFIYNLNELQWTAKSKRIAQLETSEKGKGRVRKAVTEMVSGIEQRIWKAVFDIGLLDEDVLEALESMFDDLNSLIVHWKNSWGEDLGAFYYNSWASPSPYPLQELHLRLPSIPTEFKYPDPAQTTHKSKPNNPPQNSGSSNKDRNIESKISQPETYPEPNSPARPPPYESESTACAINLEPLASVTAAQGRTKRRNVDSTEKEHAGGPTSRPHKRMRTSNAKKAISQIEALRYKADKFKALADYMYSWIDKPEEPSHQELIKKAIELDLGKDAVDFLNKLENTNESSAHQQ
ncbi:hypothetical protein NP233_g8221 [Leucocoprinus birnbaumii]|uniref:Ubiquitin-like protease family profile domain-containing protein n=1 Tax=Leucocoprinus birnbaumii TaxID=56174 RepID=A0AAD5YNC6_9AGAR|nr:hypothetical protein NP233_g8221 [Leucocoprinus birnbaumii]